MAELVEEVAVVPTAGSVAHPRVSWGAVFAGAVTAVGLWMLLYAFGLAIGASTLNVQDAGSAKASGIFTGVWGVFAPLVALFVGGLVAGRGAGVTRRLDGGMHGLVTWGLAAVAGAWLLTAVMGAIAGGVTAAGAGLARATSAVGANAGSISQAMRSAGLNPEDAVAPLNQRLRSEGRPPVRPDQLEAAARDALTTSVREGRLDQRTLVQAVADNTSLSRADAEQLAGQMNAQLENARARLVSEAQSATSVASKVLWGTFVALALGLIAAVIGGIVGVPGARSERRRREATALPARGPVPAGPPREVYP